MAGRFLLLQMLGSDKNKKMMTYQQQRMRRWRWSRLIALMTATRNYLTVLSTLFTGCMLFLLLLTLSKIDYEQKESSKHENNIVVNRTSASNTIQGPLKKSDSNDDRIFFHETSGRMELSFRQNCAVESAALHNPQRPIEIFFQPQQQSNVSSAIDQSSAWIQVLSRYANVQVIVIDDDDLYFKDSPLEDWYTKGEWRNSPYRVQHMADYIRMVTLKKGGGGMYLDLDIITLKSYDGLQFRNFVTAKNKQLFRITNAVFHLDSGHRLIDAIIKEQRDEYDPDDYVYNGPGAMSMAMTKLCNYSRGHLESNICDDVALLPHFLFHPIGGQSGHVYFMHRRGQHIGLVSTFIERMERLSYGAHIQNFMTRDLVVDTSSNTATSQQQQSSSHHNLTQVFAIMAASHCPVTFAHRFQFPFL